MAKRHLGLGKASKSKKQKTVEDEAEQINQEDAGQLTVELNEEADADDELAQLKALWLTYVDGERDNELVVNGVIHECDRLLRAHDSEDNTNRIDLPDYFHVIYGAALAELAKYHTDDIIKVKEYYEAGLERLDTGLKQHPRSYSLLFTKANVLCNQVPMQYISQYDLESEGDLCPILDEALAVYESAEKEAELEAAYNSFNKYTLDILQTVDDTLEIIDNFGKDDDEEDDENQDEEAPELPKSHPLYNIQHMDKYNNWWREHTIKFFDMVEAQLKGDGIKIEEHVKPSPELATKHADRLNLRRKVSELLGQSYLQEAEGPSSVYTTLTYDDDFKDTRELQGLTADKAQSLAQESYKTALKYLKWAEDEEEPETWVTVAEAMISLGNMYPVDSKDQENWYKQAETILNRANNATNGKFDDILQGLLGKEDDEEHEDIQNEIADDDDKKEKRDKAIANGEKEKKQKFKK